MWMSNVIPVPVQHQCLSELICIVDVSISVIALSQPVEFRGLCKKDNRLRYLRNSAMVHGHHTDPKSQQSNQRSNGPNGNFAVPTPL
jgi:hypothetical protein